MTALCISPVCVCDCAGGTSCKAAEAGNAKSCHLPRNYSQVPCCDLLVSCSRLLTVAHLTENAETAAQTAVTASTYPLVVLSAQHADLNCMIT